MLFFLRIWDFFVPLRPNLLCACVYVCALKGAMQEKSTYHVLTPKTDLGESEYFKAIEFALEDRR